MAFSKARILRFNEINSCAPPPGAYNPKYEENVVNTTVSSKNKLNLPSPSPSWSDTKSVNSNSSTPCFRTPVIPRRKKLTLLTNSAGRKCTGTKPFSPKQAEALREKMVECKNKDETIKDLEEQLEELKVDISNLKTERDTVIKERDALTKRLEEYRSDYENDLIEIKSQYSKDIETINQQLAQSLADNKIIVEDFKIVNAELRAKNAAEMKQLQENIELLENNVKRSLQEAEETLKETESKLENKETACCNLQGELLRKCEELRELELEYNESLTTQVELQRSHANEIDSLKKFHRTEVEDIEYELLKVVTEWRNVVEKRENDHIKQINMIKTQEEEKLDEMKIEYEKRETELREQSQKQIKHVQLEFEEKYMSRVHEETEMLHRQRDEAIQIAEIETLKRRNAISCYEITLQKTRATMDILKRRLLESDFDVERLKDRVAQLESENYIETRVRDLELRLLARVDEFKLRADAEIARLNNIVDQKQHSISELSSFIHEQQRLHFDAQTLIADAKIELERLEAEKTDFEFKISRLENGAQRAQTEAAKLANEKEILLAQSEKLIARNAALEEALALQNALINPLKEKLHMYEDERDNIISDNEKMSAEILELEKKFVQLLDEQSSEQKLAEDLKTKECGNGCNCVFAQDEREYAAMFQQQNQTIELLKQEIAQLRRPARHRSPAIDKENTGCGSPAKQLVKTTPTRFGSPLRERN